KSEYSKGIALIVVSTILWGIAGNIGAYLFKNKGVAPEYLTMLRVFGSGIILLIYKYIKDREEIFKIFEDKKDVSQLLYFCIFSLQAMQYGFLVAIQHSDASTATILQSLSPFIIVIFLAIKRRTWPPRAVSRALFLGLIGAF